MRRASRVWAGLLAGLFGVGCLGPVVAEGGGFRHRKHDYRVDVPDGPGPAWESVDVEGATLAFRRPGPDTLSLLSRCGKPVARAELMARHLVIGLDDREILQAGPLEVDGRNGWTQTVETSRDGGRVRVKTVTLVVGDCALDFVLVSAGAFDPAERAFDAWWQSLRLGARHAEAPVP